MAKANSKKQKRKLKIKNNKNNGITIHDDPSDVDDQSDGDEMLGVDGCGPENTSPSTPGVLYRHFNPPLHEMRDSPHADHMFSTSQEAGPSVDTMNDVAPPRGVPTPEAYKRTLGAKAHTRAIHSPEAHGRTLGAKTHTHPIHLDEPRDERSIQTSSERNHIDEVQIISKESNQTEQPRQYSNSSVIDYDTNAT